MGIVQDIFSYIEDHQLSQGEFAKKTGISEAQLSNWKTLRRCPSEKSFLKILDALVLPKKLKEVWKRKHKVELESKRSRKVWNESKTQLFAHNYLTGVYESSLEVQISFHDVGDYSSLISIDEPPNSLSKEIRSKVHEARKKGDETLMKEFAMRPGEEVAQVSAILGMHPKNPSDLTPWFSWDAAIIFNVPKNEARTNKPRLNIICSPENRPYIPTQPNLSAISFQEAVERIARMYRLPAGVVPGALQNIALASVRSQLADVEAVYDEQVATINTELAMEALNCLEVIIKKDIRKMKPASHDSFIAHTRKVRDKLFDALIQNELKRMILQQLFKDLTNSFPRFSSQ